MFLPRMEPYRPFIERAMLSGPARRSQGYGRTPKADGVKCCASESRKPQRASLVDRRIGRQCSRGDCGPKVPDGVTPVQGLRETDGQGEGVEKFRAIQTPKRIALGY